MSHTVYVDFHEINKLQTDIMIFVSWWVHKKKTPIPYREIIVDMTSKGVKDFTTIKAINVLVKKGYIRRAYISSNKTYFVQLRGI